MKHGFKGSLVLVAKKAKRAFFGTLSAISPRVASHLLYWYTMHRPLHLRNPRTLNEKIMWLKLNTYKDNALVTQCADKLMVRDYVQEKGLGGILTGVYGAWTLAEEIDWDSLPKSFVLKCTHGCGYNIICPDKALLDRDATTVQLSAWLRHAYWRDLAEIHYRGITPTVLCEEYLGDDAGNAPVDYKLYCFNGRAFYMLVCVERRNEGAKYYFFDRDWQLLRINQAGKSAPEGFTVPKPSLLAEMYEYAEVLSAPFPFVRVDLYVKGGQIYFGELTFTPSAGLDDNRLPETDLFLGDLLTLPPYPLSRK